MAHKEFNNLMWYSFGESRYIKQFKPSLEIAGFLFFMDTFWTQIKNGLFE